MFTIEEDAPYMFSERVHVFFNCLFLFQCTMAICSCIMTERWFPSSSTQYWNGQSFFIQQFGLMLIVHGLLYVSELVSTTMFTDFHSMAAHHVISLLIFEATLLDPKMICSVSLIPYFIHHAYWALGARYDFLLYLYNIYFFLLGVWAFGKFDSVLPLFSVMLPIVNYYSYCVFYDGYMCSSDSIVTNGIVSFFIFMTTMTMKMLYDVKAIE
jgi:hypothetical protein